MNREDIMRGGLWKIRVNHLNDKIAKMEEDMSRERYKLACCCTQCVKHECWRREEDGER